MIEVGQKIPSVDLFVLGDDGPESVSSNSLFAGRHIALFGVPGAFTRTCSAKHLPGYIEHLDALKAAGVDEVMCLSTNDVFVLAAWAEIVGAEDRITMIGDGSLSFTRAAGFEADMSAKGFGARCRRFSMLVRDGVVTHLHLEPPNDFGETSAEVLLADLENR